MGSIAKIISTKMENFVISTIEKRLGFKIEATHISPSGDDSPPLPKDKTFIVTKDESGTYVILGNLMISQGAKAGEKILYSRDSQGKIKSKLYLKGDGTFTFNDGAIEAARNGDKVLVTIPAGTYIESVSGGSGSPAVGVPNALPLDVEGTIQEGTSEVLLP
jgi:hypothetical protein